MKAFKLVAAQGEITIRRLGGLPKHCKLPKGYTAMPIEGGRYVVGHSETGHHHVIDAAGATIGVLDRPPEGMQVLYAILEKPLALEHLCDFDRHDTIIGDPGVYEIRIAREYDPYADLARQSAD
jgi:hypothetical protein